TELLGGVIENKEQSTPYIANIRKAVDRGTSLTRQLLSFTRKTAINPQLIDLNTHLKDVAKLIRPLMGDDVEIIVQPRSASAIVESHLGHRSRTRLNDDENTHA